MVSQLRRLSEGPGGLVRGIHKRGVDDAAGCVHLRSLIFLRDLRFFDGHTHISYCGRHQPGRAFEDQLRSHDARHGLRALDRRRVGRFRHRALQRDPKRSKAACLGT
ncbi:unnamed protein product, partial [Effrenium voratum]